MTIRRRFTDEVTALLADAASPVLDLAGCVDADGQLSKDAALARAPYDTVASIGVLSHIADLDGALPVVKEAMAPGGRLVFVDYEPASGLAARLVARRPRHDVRAALWRNGFTVVESKSWRDGRRTVVGGEARVSLTRTGH